MPFPLKKSLSVSPVTTVAIVSLSVLFLSHTWKAKRTVTAFAAQEWEQAALQSSNGGMAQYGTAMQGSQSSSATLQALSNWNTYVASRSGWSMSSTLLSRLATADWNARQAGAPTLTAQQLATAATDLINNQLKTMTAAQQNALFAACFSVQTPKGKIGLNPNYPYISGSQNGSGQWTVTVQPTAFSSRKTDFATLAPGMVSSYSNFYPGEAMLVVYSVATWDTGYGSGFIPKATQRIADLTGLSTAGLRLYGDNGYLIRRPIAQFVSSTSLSQFFTELGF